MSGTYIVFNANHTLESELGPELLTINFGTRDSYRLNEDSMYAIFCGGKRWDVTFRRWYGSYAIFYCPMRDNMHAVPYELLRTLVKRVKAEQICQFPCDCPNPNDCSHVCEDNCGQPATKVLDDGLPVCGKHYNYTEMCKERTARRDVLCP